jgi:outer membrane protein assembly factor BamD (BamD/ComL family)
MSLTGISSSILSTLSGLQTQQSPFQQIKSEFQQLGQDLQSGNLNQAQSDFTTLSQNLSNVFQGGTNPATTAATTTAANTTAATTSPILQAFSQLGQDLQSGNLQAAQQDFTNIQQDAQQASAQVGGHHHHHAAESSQSSSASQQSNPIDQAFSQLAQSLQSGNLQGAQQSYSALQSDLQQIGGFTSSGATTPTSTAATTGGINISV